MTGEWFFSKSHLGDLLRFARKCGAYTLRDLAKLSGVSASQILRIESGEYDLHVTRYLQIAQALGVPSGLLLEQAIRVSPGFYSKIIGEKGHLGRILLSARQGKGYRNRAELTHLACGSCLALSYLLKSSVPARVVTVIEFPSRGLQERFAAMAARIEQMHMADRASILSALIYDPVETLLELRLILGEPGERPDTLPDGGVIFKGEPDSFKLLFS